MSDVSIDSVSLTYVNESGAFPALENVSLTIKEGEFVSFIGPSGCGKTTLLSIIAGLLEQTSGSLYIKNTESIGYMLQHDYLFPWLTIEKNMTLGQRIQGTHNEVSHRKALRWLERFGLADKKFDLPKALSGGMRQRVALIRTLATDPSLILLDEPFSALDQQTKLKLEDLVSHTLKAEQKTAILVTHDISEAIAMSDRVILFSPRPGKVAQVFTIPQEIRACTPFESRQHKDFQDQFQLIWKELDRFESN
ncbi:MULTISPECIES: ABC transporter ATP-binding protein [Shouchella]|uniref:ABC transporter ATP-binding protein n=2 Tax=Shouchella TaxID=2893057 RepID=A0ABY7W8X7_9BACI|nr:MULTISPECIES: ABC transporter ATP-binding protein [Shouchella]MED4130399.1 ABC transporter ATP-binding protein [Shouchella miscanthi]WDF04287.1 ABC transporter ATP-binding protein [Shouchella hunanensis]